MRVDDFQDVAATETGSGVRVTALNRLTCEGEICEEYGVGDVVEMRAGKEDGCVMMVFDGGVV